MWFKNLVLYRFTKPFNLNPETLSRALTSKAFRPCAALDTFTYGWEPPLGRLGTEFIHAANGCILLCARKESKLLPPAVVNDVVTDRISRIEEQEMREVRRKERQRLRDEVTFELLPRAFSRNVRTFAYIMPVEGWLVVDAASVKPAEDLLVLLGHSVEGLPIEPFTASMSPEREMTRWLSEGSPGEEFSFEFDCELRDPADTSAVVRCQHVDLTGSEIRTHLEAGKEARRIALRYGDGLSFVLTSDLTVKRLRFEDVEETRGTEEGDEVARFDADFAFMTTEISPLLAALSNIFEDPADAASGHARQPAGAAAS